MPASIRRRFGIFWSQLRTYDRPVGLALVAFALLLSWPSIATAWWLRGVLTPMALPDQALIAFLLALASLLITSRPWLSLLVILPLYLAQPGEWFTAAAHHTLITPEMMATCTATNPGEAGEFLRSRWLGLAVALVVVLGLWLAAFAVCWRRRATARLTRTLRYGLLLALVGGAAVTLACRGYAHGGPVRRLAHTAWAGMPLRLGIMLHHRAEVRRLAAARAAWRHDAEAVDEGPQLHVLVIGESCRVGHWQLQGYPRETNPSLSKREHLAWFTDVAACGNLTIQAVPPMLTGLAPGDGDGLRRRSSLVAAAREAGYHTLWLSNQSPNGYYDNLVAAYALEADETRWLNAGPVASEWGSVDASDLRLVAALEAMLPTLPPRTLAVLHLQGSHLRYECRSDPGHSPFQPAPPAGDRRSYQRHRTEMWNAYDNSIVMTDAVVDACIDLVAAHEGAGTVSFVGDHGESLHDDGAGFHGHGFYPPPVWELRVPWLVWAAPAWRAARPGAWEVLLAHRDRAVSTRDLFHTQLDLMGVRIRERNPTRSLCDPAYGEHPRLLVAVDGSVLDFDADVVDAAGGKVAPLP